MLDENNYLDALYEGQLLEEFLGEEYEVKVYS